LCGGLRFRLFLLVLVPVAALAAVFLQDALEERRRSVAALGAEAVRVAGEFAREQQHLLVEARHHLELLARVPAVRRLDAAACRPVLAQAHRTEPQYTLLGLVDRRGRLVAASVPVAGSLDVSDRAFFRRVLAARGFAVGEYVVGRITGKPTLHLGYPVLDRKKEVAGVLAAGLDLDRLGAAAGASEHRLPPGSTVACVDARGTVLFQRPAAEGRVGRAFPVREVVEAVVAGRRGVLEADRPPRGEVMVYAVAPVEGPAGGGGIFAVTGTPRRILHAAADRQLARRLGWLSAAAAVAFGLAWLAAGRFIVAPLGSMAAALERIAGGDYAARTGLAGLSGDLGALAEGIDRAAEALAAREAARAAAEEALRESERRYRDLFENHPLPLWVYEEQTLAFLAVNEAAVARYGYSREEFLRMTIRDLHPPEDLPDLLARTARVPGGFDGARIRRHRTKSGEIVFDEVAVRPLVFGGRRARIVMAQDVSERLRAVEELARSEERFRILIEDAADVITVVDAAATIRYQSPSVERITGYRPHEMVGRNGMEYIHPDDRPFLAALLRDLLARPGTTAAGRYRFRCADGGYRHVESTGKAVTGLYDEPVVVINSRDVTERVRAEEALQRSEEQLRQAQKMEAVGRLAGGVAHDFNNLLTAITGYAEILRARIPPEDSRRKAVDEIRRAADRAAALTRQLLTFSRQQVVSPRTLDLNALLGGMLSLLQRLIGEDVAVDVDFEEGLWPVAADPAQMEQLVMNLAVNSRDAMPRGGRLVLSTRNVVLERELRVRDAALPPGPYVTLSVADTGCGMDEATLSHLFEPFFTTKEQGKGTGLGLSTVWGIARQAGGAVLAQSTPGAGTVMTVYLPRGEAAARAPRAPETGAAPAGGGETILLVEDDEAVRQVVVEILEGRGYRVLAAADAQQALSLAAGHEGSVDLLITDVVMPGMNGADLAARMAALRPGIRVLFMSGYPRDVVGENGVIGPHVIFLQKPFAPSALARRVRELLDGPPAPAPRGAGPGGE